MKIKILLCLLSLMLLLVGACTKDKEILSLEKPITKDSVEVRFKFMGDFDVSNETWKCRSKNNLQTIYHIRIIDPQKQVHYQHIGHIGLFNELDSTKILLEKNKNYKIMATALKDADSNIDLESLKTVTLYVPEDGGGDNTESYIIDIFNKFSSYFIQSYRYAPYVVGTATGSLEFVNESVDRFYDEQTIQVTSNECINMELKRFSYKLQIEMNAPTEGEVELSCVAPAFKYRLKHTDEKLSVCKIYSLGGFDISKASRNIILNLECFDDQGNSMGLASKEVTVKPNIRTIVKVRYKEPTKENSFNLILDKTEMKDEEFILE